MTNALKNSISRLGQQLDTFKKGAALINVALDALQPYAKQSRKTFDQDALNELAATIKDVGILEPLLVRPIGDGKYEVIAGERRLRAGRMVGLAEIPVLVKALDDEAADKVHLYENIHRENLSNLDLAQRIEQDLAAAGGKLADVALKYGKTKSWVSKLSTIAKGGDVLAELVQDGVSSDRAVLSTIATLEKKAPQAAKELVKSLKEAAPTANKRDIAEKFAQPAPSQASRAVSHGKRKQTTPKNRSGAP
jgi:ParB family transcriptional regulator, chromosome partitioning protein